MGGVLVRAISWFSQLLVFMLFCRAIFAWFVRDLNSPLGQVYNVLGNLTEPIVDPCRRFLSKFNTGMFDWSIFAAMLLVEVIAKLLIILVKAVF